MSDPVALYDEADKLKDEGKLDEAVAKFNEALQAEPNYALAHWRSPSYYRNWASTRKRLGMRGRPAKSSRTIRSASPRSA